MKKVRLLRTIFIFVLIIFLNKLNVHTYSYSNRYKNIDLQEVEELLNYRNNIMKDGLFNNRDIKIIERQLSEVEKGEILYNDIDIIKKLRECPTDYAYPLELKISSIEGVVYNELLAEFHLKIQWEISYLNNEETKEELLYKIQIVDYKGSLFICGIEIIE